MCLDVVYKGEYISDVDTLAERLKTPIVMQADVKPMTGECLCRCDTQAMAIASGKSHERTNDPFVPIKISD